MAKEIGVHLLYIFKTGDLRRARLEMDGSESLEYSSMYSVFTRGHYASTFKEMVCRYPLGQ